MTGRPQRLLGSVVPRLRDASGMPQAGGRTGWSWAVAPGFTKGSSPLKPQAPAVRVFTSYYS